MSQPALTAVPTLDALAAHPEEVHDLSSQAAAHLLTKVVALQVALLGQLLNDRAARLDHEPIVEERLLSVEEAAHKLGASEDWLYRNSKKLPFTVRNGRQLRFSERGIDRWIRTRQGLA